MAEPFADDLHRHAILQKQRGVRVTAMVGRHLGHARLRLAVYFDRAMLDARFPTIAYRLNRPVISGFRREDVVTPLERRARFQHGGYLGLPVRLEDRRSVGR